MCVWARERKGRERGREHIHAENKVAGPSVIQKQARASTCGHILTWTHTHLGRRSSQNNLNTQIYQQQHTHSPHTPQHRVYIDRWLAAEMDVCKEGQWGWVQMVSNKDYSQKLFHMYYTLLVYKQRSQMESFIDEWMDKKKQPFHPSLNSWLVMYTITSRKTPITCSSVISTVTRWWTGAIQPQGGATHQHFLSPQWQHELLQLCPRLFAAHNTLNLWWLTTESVQQTNGWQCIMTWNWHTTPQPRQPAACWGLM